MFYQILNAHEIISQTQEIEWFWEKRIPKKAVSMLASLGGEGKSALALWLCLKIGCVQGKNCMYVDTEQTLNHISSRLINWASYEEKLHLIMPVEKDEESGFLESASPSINEIAKMAVETKSELIVIDSLTTIGSDYDLNKRNDAARLFRYLRKIAVRADAAVLVIAHLNKPYDPMSSSLSIDRISGSQALVDMSRSVLLMETSKEDNTQKTIVHGKSNFCEQQNDITLTLTEDGVVDWAEVPSKKQLSLNCGTKQTVYNEIALQGAQEGKSKRDIRKYVKEEGGSEMSATRAISFLESMGYNFK